MPFISHRTGSTHEADQRNLFYGVNFELSNTTSKFAQTRFGLEIRPMIGVRVALLQNMGNPVSPPQWEAMKTVASALGLSTELLDVRSEQDIAWAFAVDNAQ